ncbi:hypothetical protein RSOLAG22IIIB_12150 [Rhizoctonia solani]|uniref:Uncharacterized protein n=1 Tax=Rhizoctonia solani TaxID=456999 RepID=A0A0K6GCP0_9AGAM|nr:hypothetical protein RSOLAG22IIIB_12150 [Rhizoctonia solani]
MPASSAKRKRTESSRKREGRENEEGLKRAREDKKNSAKTRKTRRKEAEEDDLLVEREGESTDVTQLRVLSLKLDSDNQRLRAELMRRDKLQQLVPVKRIPEPEQLSSVDVELIRMHLDLVGEEFDHEWFGYRSDARECLNAGGLDANKRFVKQNIDRINTITHALENRRPKLKAFDNHWASTFLLKECHNNLLNYRRKVNPGSLPSNPSNPNDSGPPNNHPNNPGPQSSEHGGYQVDDEDDDPNRKSQARKAALLRAVARKAAKLQARADMEARLARLAAMDQDAGPHNDGETEPEDLPDHVHKIIEREEVGVPADSQAPLKPVPREGSAGASYDTGDLSNKSNGSVRSRKPPVTYKAQSRRSKPGNVGRATAAGAAVDPEVDELSSSSGQTLSGSGDDDDEWDFCA